MAEENGTFSDWVKYPVNPSLCKLSVGDIFDISLLEKYVTINDCHFWCAVEWEGMELPGVESESQGHFSKGTGQQEPWSVCYCKGNWKLGRQREKFWGDSVWGHSSSWALHTCAGRLLSGNLLQIRVWSWVYLQQEWGHICHLWDMALKADDSFTLASHWFHTAACESSLAVKCFSDNVLILD